MAAIGDLDLEEKDPACELSVKQDQTYCSLGKILICFTNECRLASLGNVFLSYPSL